MYITVNNHIFYEKQYMISVRQKVREMHIKIQQGKKERKKERPEETFLFYTFGDKFLVKFLLKIMYCVANT